MIRCSIVMSFCVLSSLLFLSSSSIIVTGQIDIVQLQKLGDDDTGDSGSVGLDIVSSYGGSTNQMLMLLVEYKSRIGSGLQSLVTLRNTNGDIFLIKATSMSLGKSISIYEATSLDTENKALSLPLVSYEND
ncbi:MAG: hypothetical protein ACW99A_13675, partial [Candidatus Kariarchaeaceae archaeon]